MGKMALYKFTNMVYWKIDLLCHFLLQRTTCFTWNTGLRHHNRPLQSKLGSTKQPILLPEFLTMFDKLSNRWVIGFYDNDRPKIYLNNAWYDVSGGDIPINEWVHLVYTRDSSNNLELYINGVAKKQGLNSGSKDIGGSSVARFGSRYDGTVQFFDGKLDEFKVFNYARTPAQVAWDYSKGKPVGHWKLSEITTPSYDSSD
jgi:hypothetical protein